MTSRVEISVPTAGTSNDPKPHTVYTISLREPLRSFRIEKRYSDFVDLHAVLTSQAGGVSPPEPLPQKFYFKSTVNNPDLSNERRQALELYLRAINQSPSSVWRSTHAWRNFLNLTEGETSRANSYAGSAPSWDPSSGDITDPSIWLDIHSTLKSQLRDTRLQIVRRDQAQTTKEEHGAAAEAKIQSIKAGATILQLEKSLDGFNKKTVAAYDGSRLGQGEIQRRKDLLTVAKRDKNALDVQISTPKSRSVGAGGQLQSVLQAGSTSSQRPAAPRSGQSSRRVLGGPIPETDYTRELDNHEVLQLQKQIMQDQDQDVGRVTNNIRRMKEMGIQINEELAAQSDLLDILDQDVDRVDSKIKIGKKRMEKIS